MASKMNPPGIGDTQSSTPTPNTSRPQPTRSERQATLLGFTPRTVSGAGSTGWGWGCTLEPVVAKLWTARFRARRKLASPDVDAVS